MSCPEKYDPEKRLRSILAVIHRDSGLHTDQVGLELSTVQAYGVVTSMYQVVYFATAYRDCDPDEVDVARQNLSDAIDRYEKVLARNEYYVSSRIGKS